MRIEKKVKVKRENGPFDRSTLQSQHADGFKWVLVMRLDIMFYTSVITTN